MGHEGEEEVSEDAEHSRKNGKGVIFSYLAAAAVFAQHLAEREEQRVKMSVTSGSIREAAAATHLRGENQEVKQNTPKFLGGSSKTIQLKTDIN